MAGASQHTATDAHGSHSPSTIARYSTATTACDGSWHGVLTTHGSTTSWHARAAGAPTQDDEPRAAIRHRPCRAARAVSNTRELARRPMMTVWMWRRTAAPLFAPKSDHECRPERPRRERPAPLQRMLLGAWGSGKRARPPGGPVFRGRKHDGPGRHGRPGPCESILSTACERGRALRD